jgi:hypothetical protein
LGKRKIIEDKCYVSQLHRFLFHPSQPKVREPSMTKNLRGGERIKESREININTQGMLDVMSLI